MPSFAELRTNGDLADWYNSCKSRLAQCSTQVDGVAEWSKRTESQFPVTPPK